MPSGMKEIFETFKPKNSIIGKYVDYYYLNVKPNNVINEFQCFPHFNNTISLYTSHTLSKNGEIQFDEDARPFQIFTPIREKILSVKQLGKVYRIVIVFNPLGIQQFYKNLNFADYITDFDFFNPNELNEIFSTTETETLRRLLDHYLEKRLKKYENTIIERSIEYIFNNCENFSVAEISEGIGISRQHLNRIFQLHLGVSIKKFIKIVLFRQTLNRRLFEDSNENFTKLAYEFYFNDQSHLSKTYRSLTEHSPRSFFAKGSVLGKEDTFWHLKP